MIEQSEYKRWAITNKNSVQVVAPSLSALLKFLQLT